VLRRPHRPDGFGGLIQFRIREGADRWDPRRRWRVPTRPQATRSPAGGSPRSGPQHGAGQPRAVPSRAGHGIQGSHGLAVFGGELDAAEFLPRWRELWPYQLARTGDRPLRPPSVLRTTDPHYRVFTEGSSKMTTTANEPARPVSPTSRPGPVTVADTPHPQVGLLSNGQYSVAITDAGAGVSTWRGLDVTRWREDATRDGWGQFAYVCGLEDGPIWSIGKQPLPQAVDEYQVAFHADRAEFRRRDGDIETSWAICVARDHDAEVRLVTLVNHGGRACELDLTSY